MKTPAQSHGSALAQVLLAACAALALAPLHAQTDATATPPAPAAAAAHEEVVELPAFSVAAESDRSFVGTSSLSSTRIAVDLLDLSQSVKVLNNSFLKAVNPSMMTDILEYVGGAQNGQLNWTPGRLNIRGYTGDADYNDAFAPTAASTVDSALYDRFEVIKGPSTVFLAADGSPGGILNKITKSPLPIADTTVTLQTGLFDGNHADIDSTGPITADGKLLYRIVAAEQYSNGYYDSTYMHRTTVMPALSYTFNSDTKLEVKALLVETNFPSYNGLPIDPRTDYLFNVPYTRSQSENAPYNWRHDAVHRIWFNFTSRLTDWAAFHLTGMNASDHADRVESLAATWNESARKWNTPVGYDGTQLIPRTTTADNAYTVYRDLQGDLNLNYANKYFGENLLVGGELRDNPARTITYQGAGTVSSGWNPYVVTPPVVTVNYTTPSAYVSAQSQNDRLYALETLKVLNDRVILSYGVSRVKAGQDSLNVLTDVYSTPQYYLFKNLKQYGLVLKVLPNISLFTGYNENFAINGIGTINGVANTALPPKQGKQHEVGLKSEFLNQRLSVQVSYFDIKQINNTVPSAPVDPLNPNVLVPGVISRGFDGDFSFQVSHNLYLMASFADYKAYSVLGPQDLTYVQPYYGRIVTNEIPVDNTAEHTGSLFGVYTFNDGSFKGLSVGVGANYQSKRAITDGANQVMWGYVPGRTLVNANINYRLNKHWKYSLNLDNLLDKKYIYSVRSENVIVPGQSFNFKMSASYSL